MLALVVIYLPSGVWAGALTSKSLFVLAGYYSQGRFSLHLLNCRITHSSNCGMIDFLFVLFASFSIGSNSLIASSIRKIELKLLLP
jgi:hypothetical protein